ncbi:MAG: lipid-binding SYLF domain-containing protein [bacterium]|nr:lipid-binding SYLF domain-containing protein [bacterium]MDI1336995.1 lipid-binding SYLF domain-containing protein [Lacunisphaera sp.]
MKKFLITLFCALALPGALSAAGLTRATVVQHLDTCEAILQDLQANAKTAIPADILRRAKGIVIVNQFQASFIFGIKDGYAVALVRRPNGKWSVPAFLKAGELSVGLQAGGKSINAVYVLMDDQTARLLFKPKMNLGAEAKAVAGIRAAERERMTQSLTTEPNVYVYSATEGLFLGAALKTGYMSPHEEANRLFYDTNNRLPELLFSDWVTPPTEARFIMDYVTRITQ